MNESLKPNSVWSTDKDRAELKPITQIDIGELLIETVKNSEHIDVKLQRTISNFVDITARPILTVEDIGEKLFGPKE